MVLVSTAPSLVAVGVVGIFAGTGVGDGDHDGCGWVAASVVAVGGGPKTVGDGAGMTLDFVALAAGSLEVVGLVRDSRDVEPGAAAGGKGAVAAVPLEGEGEGGG